MANIKSQMKRNRQTVTRTQRNKSVRSEMKTRMRKALEAAQSQNADAAREALRLAQASIDRATSRGVLHANTAARRKARLHRRVEELLGS